MLAPFKEYEHPSGVRYHAELKGASAAFWSLKNQYRLPDLATRGQLLALLSALGIPTAPAS